MTEQQKMTAEQQQAWVRDQYLVATKYIADQGGVVESVADTQSRYLVPIMAVWKLNLLDKTTVWVICGDLPTDQIVLQEDEPAREVVRHFSFKWQVKAEEILQQLNHDNNQANNEQQQYAHYLIGRAEGLYQLYQQDELWQESV